MLIADETLRCSQTLASEESSTPMFHKLKTHPRFGSLSSPSISYSGLHSHAEPKARFPSPLQEAGTLSIALIEPTANSHFLVLTRVVPTNCHCFISFTWALKTTALQIHQEDINDEVHLWCQYPGEHSPKDSPTL